MNMSGKATYRELANRPRASAFDERTVGSPGLFIQIDDYFFAAGFGKKLSVS